MALLGETDFWSRVTKQEDGCWMWSGPVTMAGHPYPTIDGERRGGMLHAWRLATGEDIPDGLSIYRRGDCGSRLCLNPDHFIPPLTEGRVQEAIARKQATGATWAEVAREMGVPRPSLSRKVTAFQRQGVC